MAGGLCMQGWIKRYYWGAVDSSTTSLPTNLEQRLPDVGPGLVDAIWNHNYAPWQYVLWYFNDFTTLEGAPGDYFAAVFTGYLRVANFPCCVISVALSSL
jgi:hypothetical protein